MACEIPSSVYSGRNRSGFLPDSLSQYPAAYVPVILFTSQQFNYADTDSNIPVFQLQPWGRIFTVFCRNSLPGEIPLRSFSAWQNLRTFFSRRLYQSLPSLRSLCRRLRYFLRYRLRISHDGPCLPHHSPGCPPSSL